MQIAQFAKAVFNLSAICKTKKCIFRSTRWRIVPLSICVICANCTICQSCFQFECNLQNEEMSFQSTVINLCNCAYCLQKLFSIWVEFCKSTRWKIVPLSICVICAILHNLQKLFSIWVQSAKWRNVFSDLHSWSTVINLCNLCKLHNLQKLFSIWVQSAKWRNVFQIYRFGGLYRYQFV